MSTYRVAVDGLSLHDDRAAGRTLHYEHDHDLNVHTKMAQRGGDRAAVVLIELGLDGYHTHLARLDFCPMIAHEGEEIFRYSHEAGEDVRALTDAIDTLTALRDQIARVAGDA